MIDKGHKRKTPPAPPQTNTNQKQNKHIDDETTSTAIENSDTNKVVSVPGVDRIESTTEKNGTNLCFDFDLAIVNVSQ